MKKHSNFAKKCEPSIKCAQSRVSARQDSREVMTELVTKLTNSWMGRGCQLLNYKTNGEVHYVRILMA